MANENAIRIAAIVLLLAVVAVSYMQWGKGVDAIPTTPTQEFMSAEQLAERGAAPAPAGKTATPGGAGWTEGQEGPEGGEGTAPAGEGMDMPAGGAWASGEEGPEGGENAGPSGLGGVLPEGGGWALGEEGPAGSEGRIPEGEEPAGTSVGLCWKKAKADTTYSYDFSGTVATTGFPADKVKELQNYAVVATDRPISQWTSGAVVQVYGVTTGQDPEFSLSVKSDQRKLHLCAVWPASLDEFQSLRIASCTSKALDGGKGNAEKHGDIVFEPKPLPEVLLVIGGDRFRSGPPREGLVRVQVSGKVEAVGVPAGSFLVAAASTPILDEQESEDDPRTVRITGADGKFALSYLAPPGEKLYLCAMALPRGQELGKISSIEGQGCTQAIEPPPADTEGVVNINGVAIRVNAEKMPLAPHEQDHLSLVGRCSGDS